MDNNNIEQLAEHATQQTVLLIMERMKDQSITVKCPESYRLGLEVALNQLHMSFYGIFTCKACGEPATHRYKDKPVCEPCLKILNTPLKIILGP